MIAACWLAIQFAVFTHASQCEQGLDTVMHSHVVCLKRILRVLQSLWTEKAKQDMTATLRDIPSLVQNFVGSFLSHGRESSIPTTSGCRCQYGIPARSYILCSAVALQRE